VPETPLTVRSGALTIDAHVHFWQYDPIDYAWIDGTMTTLRRHMGPGELGPLLEAAGLDGCVAVQARQTAAENDWLLGLADTHRCIAGVVGWVDLLSPGVERRLERCAAHPRMVGVRHVVQEEPPGFMARADFRRGIAALARTGLAYDILIRAHQLPEAIDLAAAFPDQRFVLDHLGKPDIRGGEFASWSADLRRLAALPHVCAKLSGLVTEADWARWTPEQLRPYVETALDAFGPMRLMIGSDWPVCTLAAPYGEALAVVERAIGGLTGDERAQVRGGTARTFWRLRSDT
jgi:L-fuconolactonase